MLDALRSLFSFETPETKAATPSEHDVHLAAAVLLLEVAYADFEVTKRELSIVTEALGKRLDLTGEEVRKLIDIAVALHHDHSSLYPFLRRVNGHFDPDQKRSILEDMWRVAYADNALDKYEEHRIRRMADMLHVSHSEFIRTKLKVKEELESGKLA